MSDGGTSPADEPQPAAETWSSLIPSLPDDVALNCLARVPRHHHPTLSLVSKPIRSLLSSPLLYTTRSLLQCTQHFLYVSLRLSTHPSQHWYTLYQNPLSAKYPGRLVPVPSIPTPNIVGSAVVSSGHEIYVIGGSVNDIPSARVWVLDCRLHAWRRAPDMRVGREFAAAGVIDGKIYVIGGCVTDSWTRSANWAAAFDTSIGAWEVVPSPGDAVREKWMHASAVMRGKIYAMADRNGVVYVPSERRWDVPEKRLDLGWRGRACVIDNVLYCYDYLGKIRAYDPKDRLWREVKGLDKGLPRFLCGATMANFGGKLAVLWEDKSDGTTERGIWCAMINVHRRDEGDICGRIEWCNLVLKVPKGSAIMHCSTVVL